MNQFTFDGATNHITSGGITYDAAGNVTYDGFHTYTYDGESRLKQVDSGNSPKYNYDAFGNRNMQYAPPVYNEYVLDLSGRAITAIAPGTSTVYTAEVNAGGRHWVTDNGSALFLGGDWVGTSRALTNLSGTFDQLYTTLPWGDSLSFAGNGSSFHTTSQFTGKEYDPESNLYHFPARKYAPTQGRWLTPDPGGLAVMDITNPQSWNRYAYVINNPVSNTDPTGLVTINPNWYMGFGGGWAWEMVGALLQGGGAVQCPNNDCGIGTSTPYQCVGSACGYMSNQYVATHENEWNGVLYSDSEWQTFLTDRVDAQRQALADAISWASDKDYMTWDYVYSHLQYTGNTIGGSADFSWFDAPLSDLSFIPGYNVGGCEVTCRFGDVPSIHMPGGGQLHLDSGNPLWGFGVGALVHGFIDVGLGNINPSVPMSPW